MSHKSTVTALPPFGKMNYILLLAGIVLIIIGYVIMSTEEFVDATEFSLTLYVVPFIILAGFISVGIGIMKKQKGTVSSTTTDAE